MNNRKQAAILIVNTNRKAYIMAAAKEKYRAKEEKVRYLGEDGTVYVVPVGVRVPCHPRAISSLHR